MFSRLKPFVAAGTVACATVALVACGSDSNVSPNATGSVGIMLTDAPFPFDSVARADIFVVRIDGRVASTDSAGAEAGKDDDSNSNTDPSKGWVTLAAPNAVFNLLDLQNGKTVNLGQASLASGTYQGFRIIIDASKSSITLRNGTVLNASNNGIKFPSAARSGIKIQLAQPYTVVSGKSQMVVDFDLGHSFVMRGHSLQQNGLLFKPVIRATAIENTGGISGVVHADSAKGAVEPNASVEILKAGTAVTDTVSANVIATTKSDSTGAYAAMWLTPGTYAVRATPPSTDTAHHAAVVDNIAVTSGKTTTGADVVVK
jgi:hypothetical protein